jgi:hypothetical protein
VSAVGRDAFERAVAAYRLDEVTVSDAVTAACRASLDATGLVLAGEAHGVEQTPGAVLSLVRRLGVDALGFEWSWDQFDHVVQPVLATGRLDREALWSLPAEAEAFNGDGRFTAGHVRVLETLAPRLARIVCVDRLESASLQEREEDMAERVLGALRPGGRLLVVVGWWHAGVDAADDGAEPAGALLRRTLPGLASVLLAPGRATSWFGSEQAFEPQPHGLDVELPIGPARPAVVPRP